MRSLRCLTRVVSVGLIGWMVDAANETSIEVTYVAGRYNHKRRKLLTIGGPKLVSASILGGGEGNMYLTYTNQKIVGVTSQPPRFRRLGRRQRRKKHDYHTLKSVGGQWAMDLPLA